jgi:hypothetical protein
MRAHCEKLGSLAASRDEDDGKKTQSKRGELRIVLRLLMG